MGVFKKAISKAKAKAKTVKKAVTKKVSKVKTNFGKKISAKAVKRVAPKVVKKVATKSVPKAVKKSTPKATSKPKVSVSKPKATPKKQSSFVAKLSSGAKKIANKIDPVKTAYASDGSNQQAQQKQEPGLFNSWADKVQNAFTGNQSNSGQVNTGSSRDFFGNALRKYGINQDYGISEMFGGNTKSLNTVGSNANPIQKTTVSAARTINPVAKASMSNPIINPVGSSYLAGTGSVDAARYATSPTQQTGQVLGDSTASSTRGNNFSFYPGGEITNPFNLDTSITAGLPKPGSTTGQEPQYTPVEGEGTVSGGYTFTNGQWVPTGSTAQTDVGTAPMVDSQPTGQTAIDDFYGELQQTNPELYGILAPSDEEMQRLSDAGLQNYLAGNASEEEILNQQSELNRKALELQYDKIMANYASLPEEHRASADRALEEIRRQLDLTYKQGAEAKQAIENSYGEAIRRKIKTDKVSKNQLRNLYSSLGTAESSAFIEDMSEMESEGNRDIFLAEQEKSGRINSVDDLVRQAEQTEQSERARIIRERDDAINEIRANMNIAEEEKALAIQQNNLYALAELSRLQQAKEQYLLSQSENMANYRSGIAQALIPGLMEQKLQDDYLNTVYGNQGASEPVGIASMSDGNTKYNDGTIRNKYGVTVGRWK